MSTSMRQDDVYVGPGSTLIPTAIPLATGDLQAPRRKPRWSVQLAKPIAYSFGVVALGAAGAVFVGQPQDLTRVRRNVPSPAAAVFVPPPVAMPIVGPVAHAHVVDDPVVVLETDTIFWRPPLRHDRPLAEAPDRLEARETVEPLGPELEPTAEP